MANGFFTDTTLCIGCKACEVACKQWNQLPADGYEFSGNSYDNTMALGGTTWRHVAFVEQAAPAGAPPTDMKWLMMSDVCKHCTHAGCMEACPTGAIIRNEFDDVFIQPDICNGCGYCVPSCPFGVVDMIAPENYDAPRGFELDGRTNDDATQHHGGVAGKCTLCYDRQKLGLTPACAKACPTESIQFGNVEELQERAKQRVEQLRGRGVDSYLYGVGDDTTVGDLNAFFLLTAAPEAYNLPARPVLPSTHQPAGYAAAAFTAAALAVAGWAVFRGPRLSTAQLPPQPSESDRGASRGDGLPAHASQTYYEQPLLKKPHWEWEVITYLFLGGIMGGSGMLAFLADDRPEREADLARSARYVSFALAAACPAILIRHLGRPERFFNMLRIVKFKSVMSMGVWGLVIFSAPVTLAAAGQLSRDGALPAWIGKIEPRGLTKLLMGLMGGFMAGYTGVLISATAIPLWATGKRFIPALSVCSGFAGACALNAAILAICGTDRTRRKLERLELIASTAEFVLLEMFRRRAGNVGAPMFDGNRGAKLRSYTQFAGILAPAMLGLLPFGACPERSRRARPKTLLASALTLAGGFVLRETFIEAGKASADDPRAASRQPE